MAAYINKDTCGKRVWDMNNDSISKESTISTTSLGQGHACRHATRREICLSGCGNSREETTKRK